MSKKFKSNLMKRISTSHGASAIGTNEELHVIDEVTMYAKLNHGQPCKVFVWSESVGFEEAVAYKENEEGRSITEQLTLGDTNFTLEMRPEWTAKPDPDQFETAYDHALRFMEEYDAQEEGAYGIFVLRGWQQFIGMNPNVIDRQMRLIEKIRGNGLDKHIIVLGQPTWDDSNIPAELQPYYYVEQYDLPDKEERISAIRQLVNSMGFATNPDYQELVNELTDENVENLANATGGLTRLQIDDTLLFSAIETGKFDVDYVLQEKKMLVAKAGFKIIQPDSGFENIGGLAPLKAYCMMMKRRFSKEAFEYGFRRYPKGLLMAGVSGCGKSAIAKSIASEWGMNLIMASAEDFKGSLVGESEKKTGRFFRTAKAVAPCLVLVDEAEKLLGKSDGVHDGGAHDAVLGMFLSFMQEDTSGVYFIFTSNDLSKFTPELMDRFEGRFFIDLPTAEEREEILKIHLRLNKQSEDSLDMPELVKAAKDFSGRNIEQAVEEAMNVAFNDDREMVQGDLLKVFEDVVPTSKTKAEELRIMRQAVENGDMRRANETNSPKKESGKKGRNIRSFA